MLSAWTKNLSLNILTLGLVSHLLAGCESRNPVDIQTTPPPAQRVNNSAVTTPHGDTHVPPASASDSKSGTQDPGASGSNPLPPPVNNPPPTTGGGSSTSVIINPTLGGDSAGSGLNWDGKSFQGNAKWDIAADGASAQTPPITTPQGTSNSGSGSGSSGSGSGSQAPRQIPIEVAGGGYHPSSLVIAAGEAVELVMTKTEAGGCGGTVVFPDYGITKDLPLNQAVIIDLPARQAGQFHFTCGMGMYKGQIVIQ